MFVEFTHFQAKLVLNLKNHPSKRTENGISIFGCRHGGIFYILNHCHTLLTLFRFFCQTHRKLNLEAQHRSREKKEKKKKDLLLRCRSAPSVRPIRSCEIERLSKDSKRREGRRRRISFYGLSLCNLRKHFKREHARRPQCVSTLQ